MHAPGQFAEEALRKVEGFRLEEIGSVTWALASLRLRHEPLLSSLGRVLEREGDGGAAPFRVVSGFVWAHAVLRVEGCTPLISEVAVGALQQVADGRPQEIANMAWAIVALGH